MNKVTQNQAKRQVKEAFFCLLVTTDGRRFMGQAKRYENRIGIANWDKPYLMHFFDMTKIKNLYL